MKVDVAERAGSERKESYDQKTDQSQQNQRPGKGFMLGYCHVISVESLTDLLLTPAVPEELA